MSVVTEIRKTKQKWSLNPRGKAWSEDSNKFGQKMLEKMGWSIGKGLGAKENGIVEHVRASYKNDTKGMGFKETDGEWTEHDSNFNALLQSLSGQQDTQNDIKIASLEKKSQSSKVRVHYKKFTRGKDLSRCSEKDLANIFGKKSLKTPTKIVEKEEIKETPEDGFSHNAGSMVDYFKRKLPNFGKFSSPTVGNNDSESEGEMRMGFGMKTPEKKKRKLSFEDGAESTPKKMKNEDEEKIGLSNPAFDPLFNNVEVQKHYLNTIEEEESEEIEKNTKLNEESEEIKCENKKNRRSREESSSSGEETKKKKKKTESSGVVTNISETKKKNEFSEGVTKKKKKKNKEIAAVDNPNFEEIENEESYYNENFEVKRKKKKSKDLCRNIDSDSCQNSLSNEDFEIKKKKKTKDTLGNIHELKRNKKKNKETAAIDNPNFEETETEDGYVNEDFEVKRKKKKDSRQNYDSCQNSLSNENFEVKRKKKKKMALINPVFDSVENSYVNDSYEVKRTKKKHNMAVDNPNFNEESTEESTFNNEYEVKRKKKKEKNKTENLAIDNPNFNYSIEDSESSTQPKKKKKKENEETIDNSIQNLSIVDSEPKFDLILNVTCTPTVQEPKSEPKSSKRRKNVRFSDVNEERIIPNSEDIQLRNELFDINSKVISNGLKDTNGTQNLAFNRSQVILDESITEMSKKIDNFQVEIENDMNEAKIRYIGEVGSTDTGENEKLPNGTTKLKFKYADFGRTPFWAKKGSTTLAKKSYKHLIKGDIVLGFNNTNLHEIEGYAVNVNKKMYLKKITKI